MARNIIVVTAKYILNPPNMVRLLSIVIIFGFNIVAADTYEQEIQNAIVALKEITPSEDAANLKRFNSIMDSNWKTFRKNKKTSIPILVKILQDELADKSPNDLVLLDIGWFLALSDENVELNSILLKAYEKIDFSKKIITQNEEQFFRFSMFLSSRELPGFLPLIDRRFLRKASGSFVVPQHSIVVNAHAQRTHLYGAYGGPAMRHLLSILKAEKNVETRRSILSILRRICTSDCATDVYELLRQETDHEAFVNATYIMLDNAGPVGKELYLKLIPGKLSPKTMDYFKSEQEYVRKIDYDFLVAKIQKVNSVSDIGYPFKFIQSKSDKASSIEKLIEYRRKCFFRVNQHGLGDVDITNLVINAIQYQE